MAGHSKFKNIMHRKGRQDALRSKVFSRLSREITVAAKQGGSGDINANAALRLAVAQARAQSMPKSNIQKAIDKAFGSGASDYATIRYEGFGPGGVGVVLIALSDNKNRTAGDVRAIFQKFDGNLGETNSVSYLFDHKGRIIYPDGIAGEEACYEAALEAGAEDIHHEKESWHIFCTPSMLASVAASLQKRWGDPLRSGFVWIPLSYATLNAALKERNEAMLAAFDALEDVHAIFSNLPDPENMTDEN